jgi:hypothetical protein
MKRLSGIIGDVLSFRGVPHLVCGVFLLLYVALAFRTEEALVGLMGLTRTNVFLLLLLALMPLHCGARMLGEAVSYIRRRRCMRSGVCATPAPLFDETASLDHPGHLQLIRDRLQVAGYRVHEQGTTLSAWRGVSRFPARMFFLAGMGCLFAGVLVSLSSRVSIRKAVIEGEPMPLTAGDDTVVRKIIMRDYPGIVLNRTLSMNVVSADGQERTFGLYPPARYRHYFVYPRYLGIAPLVAFSAPDVQPAVETFYLLMIYPSGREDGVDVPGTPYRLMFTLADPGTGEDPYVTGKVALQFRLLKGKEPVLAGSVAPGNPFVEGGYRIAFSEYRHVVATDFVRDYGVMPMWTAAIFLGVSFLTWFPLRLLCPRREMLFCREPATLLAYSRAEGKGREHAGIFHDALDVLDAGG